MPSANASPPELGEEIFAHIIHLLFPLLIGAHVYVNAICLLPTWVYNCEYIFQRKAHNPLHSDKTP